MHSDSSRFAVSEVIVADQCPLLFAFFFKIAARFAVANGRSNRKFREDSIPEKTKKLRNMVYKKLKGKY